MDVTFLGAAQTVTGSMHLVRTGRATVLLDCGLYQGRRREAFDRNRHLPFDPRELDAVVLSHAHIDHSGALPLLVKEGYERSVFMTPATRDLCAVMLEDAARVQAADARYLNKLIDRGDLEGDHIEPLYDEEDVLALLERTVSVPYHHAFEVAPGVRVTYLDAGHVLGSAVVVLDCDDGARQRRLVFSGDVGRRHMPILRDPEVPEGANALLVESTYGDRLHPPRDAMDDALADVLTRAVERGGKVFVPTFALERAQEILYSCKRLELTQRLPKQLPIYVDSPLAIEVTDVFRMHPDCFDRETRELLAAGESPFAIGQVEYVRSSERSKEITAGPGPALILAGSGMCESGRIVHHLRAGVENPRNIVLIVGYQAVHTLGRRLVEKRSRVRIFGVERDRHCDVVVLNGFSAHADQRDLIEWIGLTRDRGDLASIALVHGELKSQRALEAKLREAGHEDVRIPEQGDAMSF
ncbi:MAG: MBL fold metallo-hydrolase RNA specificity domain-containing protein [Sandaracinaceae bacterium]